MGTLSDTLAECALVGIDTAPFIYHFEEHPDFSPIARLLFSRYDDPDDPLQAATSVITVTEVLVRPLQLGQEDIAATYKRELMSQRGLTVVPVYLAIAIRAAELRARYRFPVPDAVQLATAIETGCQLFVTNDSRLRRVTEIPIAVLSDYLAAGS